MLKELPVYIVSLAKSLNGGEPVKTEQRTVRRRSVGLAASVGSKMREPDRLVPLEPDGTISTITLINKEKI
jgi:hypothetical protein